MNESLIETVGCQYGKELSEIKIIAEGLIHKTYKLSFKKSAPVLLQCINKNIFKQPEKIIQNYCLLQEHVSKNNIVKLPALLTASRGEFFWIDIENNF